MVTPWHWVSMLTTAHQDTAISHLTEDMPIIVQETGINSVQVTGLTDSGS